MLVPETPTTLFSSAELLTLSEAGDDLPEAVAHDLYALMTSAPMLFVRGVLHYDLRLPEHVRVRLATALRALQYHALAERLHANPTLD